MLRTPKLKTEFAHHLDLSTSTSRQPPSSAPKSVDSPTLTRSAVEPGPLATQRRPQLRQPRETTPPLPVRAAQWTASRSIRGCLEPESLPATKPSQDFLG